MDVWVICINPEIIHVAPAIKMDLGKQEEWSPFKCQHTSLRSSGALRVESKPQGRAEVQHKAGARHWDLPTCAHCASAEHLP